MNSLFFSYAQTAQITNDELVVAGKQIAPEIEQLSAALTQGYATDYAALNLVVDTDMMEQVAQLVAKKKARHPHMLVVIGIGGSNLGIQAIAQALFGLLYNETHPLKVYYADTVDADHLQAIARLMEHALKAGHEVILNVISKSGSTTETIANFEFLLELLERYKKNMAHESVVAITDHGSALWQLAKNKNFECLEIPHNVGGRYSVFSAVGLFALGMMGVDTAQLVEGARSMISPCTDGEILNNPAALRAALLAKQYRQGIMVHDTFLFSVECEGIGKWYRQLMGESIGKQYDRLGNQVRVGMLPTVSIGSTDLHSVGQLYLGGPDIRFTTFVAIARNAASVDVPHWPEYNTLVAGIQGKSMAAIMDAMCTGVQYAYAKSGLAFSTIVLPEKSAYYVGQLFQMNMIEIIYLAYLLGINPFDQPEVELYKQETRKILAQ